MSDLIPGGWKYSTLSDLCKFTGGSAFKEQYQGELSGDYPFIKVSDMNLPMNQRYISQSNNWIDDHVRLKAKVKLFPKNSVVFAKVGAALLLNRRRILIRDTAIDNNMMAAQPRYDDYHFLYYIMQSIDLAEIVQSGAVPSVNQGQMDDIAVLIPPLPEQQKIAAILTSVDEVIEKTQAQIDKLKDLKTGMMQSLLSPIESKGVGIDGKPHTEFKDSPVGRIPKGWDCILLDKVAKRGSGHTPDKQRSEYWNEGIKWVSLTDSSKLDNLYLNDTAKKISQLGIENSSANMHPKGTVVMARDAGIGKSAIITDSMAVSQHFMAWVCGEKLNNYFLYYLLQLWKPNFEAIAMGSTIKTIGLPYFKKLQIPVPSIDEQSLIACALKSVDGRIFALQRKNSSLKSTKKALMQDLLTGKVRVNVASEIGSH